ncbi:MAG: HAMP domain-containing sensor histidine kinase, partial [bacterium]|nr:HAMP domain-containing sensor histidine kinase [bacterium]
NENPELSDQVPEALAFSLEQEREALQGRGNFSRRAELFSEKFLHEATDPIQIAGFGAALSTFGFTRYKLLSHLLPKARQATVLGVVEAQALAFSSGVLAESAAFALTTRSLEHFFVAPQDWSSSALATTYLNTLISLGLLRTGGALARQVPLSETLRPLMHQGTLLGALYLSGKTQVWRGQRPEVGDGALMEEALYGWIHLNAAGQIFNRVQGNGYRHWTRSLDARSQHLLTQARMANQTPAMAWGALAAAGVPFHFGTRNRVAPERNGIMLMSGKDKTPEGEGGGEGAVRHVADRPPESTHSSGEGIPQSKSMVVPKIPAPSSLPKEYARIERELGKLGPLAEVGLLASGVFHNMGNRIPPAQLFIERILPRLMENYRNTADPRDVLTAEEGIRNLESFLANTTAEIHALNEMVRGVAHPNIHQYGISLREVVQDAYGMTAFSLGKGRVKVHWGLPEERIEIHGNHGSLSNAVVNLIENARHAMPNGGELTLRVFTERDHAVIEVIDTGEGMRPAVLERIFEPLFTTKGHGQGTGLGMYMVKHTVEHLHGGKVTVTSEVNQGTTVRLELPIVH